MYDVIFVSNGELNAESNWERLQQVSTIAPKRIDGVNSIHAAYQKAAELATTEHFFLVDADNEVNVDFDFQSFVYPDKFRAIPHVVTWRTRNNVNSLIYGHGGITLYPTEFLRDTSRVGADVAQGLGIPVRSLCYVGSVHAFDFNAYNTWRTAFREAVKLRKSADRNTCPNAGWRLQVWESESNGEFGRYSVLGAKMGSTFIRDFPERMNLINNEAGLKQLYVESTAGV